MHIAYLDNSATTVVCKSAAEAAYKAMTEVYGNPSSLHKMGIEAEEYLRNTRRSISDMLSCTQNEIYFTSGGTESNNLLILGAAKSKRRTGNKIVTTSIEHPSVLNTMKQLESEGFEVTYVSPEKNGNVLIENLEEAIDEKTILVSMMYVNNETGAVLPVNEVKKAIIRKNSPALFHCDAVQAFGKIPIRMSVLSADFLSASGHKIHASKGVGFAYIKKGVKIYPQTFGGGQENGIRSGTQPVPQIAALGEAVKELKDYEKRFNYISELREFLVKELKQIDNIVINSAEDSLPYIVNFSVPGIRSEIMLHYLEKLNIFVSGGSACSKGKKSYVLKEAGLSERIIDSAVRVSFSQYNEKRDIEMLIQGVIAAKKDIKHT